MPFLDEIGARLLTKGIGALDIVLLKGSTTPIPEGPGPFLTIKETGGSGSSRTQNGTPLERPTAQIKARADDYRDARLLAKAAYDALGGASGLYNVTLSGVFYLSITARQGLTDTGADANGRATVSFNIDAEKEPS